MGAAMLRRGIMTSAGTRVIILACTLVLHYRFLDPRIDLRIVHQRFSSSLLNPNLPRA